MPIRRISSATGMPISTCFTAAVICSTEYRFRFIGKTPLSVIVPELTSALCQFFGGRSSGTRRSDVADEAQRGTNDWRGEADGGGAHGRGGRPGNGGVEARHLCLEDEVRGHGGAASRG